MKKMHLLATVTAALALIVPVRATSSHAASHLLTTSPSFPVTIVDDLHNRVRIAHLPRRIITLDPRDTETVFALGLEKRLVGDGGKGVEGAAGISGLFRYPSQWPSRWGRDYPIRSKALPHVEGGFGSTPFNLETIVSLRPDLIIGLNSDLTTVQKMRELGLTVMLLDPSSVRGILHDITLVGRATGAVTQAKTVVGTIKAEMTVAEKHVDRTHSRVRVYYEIDATNPVQPYTAGAGTFIDEVIKLAGGTNVADAIATPGCPGTGCYPQMNVEALVKLDPQVIVLGDAQYGTTADSVKARTGWGSMSAVQTGKIYPFDDELISRAGPRIEVGLRLLAKLLHPEAFRR